MSDVGVLWARAPSLEKLERQLSELLVGRDPDAILGVSYAVAPVGTRQSGGIWSGARRTHTLEYSAVVLLRD